MTDNQENKPKKLTLNTSKLTLARPLESSGLTKPLGLRAGAVTVEVKKGVASSTSFSSKRVSEQTNLIQREDVDSKINLLKKAAEDAKVREQEEEDIRNAKQRLNILMQQKAQEELEEEVSENDQVANSANPVPLPVQEHIAQHNKPNKHEHEPSVREPKETFEEVKVPVKSKWEEPRKLRKNDIYSMLDSDGEEEGRRTRSLASIKRAREKERRKHQEANKEKIYREVIIPEVITVGELASRMTERAADVIKELMKMGMIANANQSIDADTAELVVSTMGHSFKRVQDSDIENILIQDPDHEDDLESRAPVVTVMGHVDHGKTSLLDALKSTDVVAGEAGGITQHIGAYRVNLSSGASITFLDTPGHEAFTEMRSRGAKVTDIVVLVVAADDGIMAQTQEAINHAKAAGVPIIVAVNKMDKPDANLDKVKNELLQYDLIPEDFGGDIMVIPVSALKKMNLDKLEEAILLVAEMQNLKANFNAVASGAVVESKIDKGRGVVTTLLVQRGTLKVGDLIVAGTAFGKVKRMLNDKGDDVSECIPSMPVEIWGLDKPPLAGETFAAVQTEKQARDIAEYRIKKALDKKVAHAKKSSLEDLFLKATGEGGKKELSIIIKGDVQGSIEAIAASLLKLEHEEVTVKILHNAVGGITESDIALAEASSGIIVGFNVRASQAAQQLAEKSGVDIRYYSIIYNLIDDVRSILGGMLSPIIREVYIGSVDIREVFNITKVGKIAGCYVTRGIIKRGAGVRLLRNDIVIHEGKLKTLKRFKDEVKEVKENFECGIAFENYEDIKVGDKVEVFEIVQEKKTL